MRRFLLITFSLLICCRCFAQHADGANTKQLQSYQDSLINLGSIIVNNESEPERINANYKFIKTLVTALKEPDSFHFPFDSVKTVTIINAPDNDFRIISWHLTNDDGSYRFYGAVQMNTGGALRLYPLEDYSPLLKNPEDSIVNNRKWYGAQYYKIIKVTAETPYYVMLGWKGYTAESTKKVIEVLSFNKNGSPVFGLPVFDGKKGHKRIIFEYARQVSMLLKYIPEQHLIVFDHLSPPDNRYKNKPEMYGPDLTYDGFRLKNGRWEFIENMDMRNVASEQDKDYIDPKKQTDTDNSNN
jgi:hypothetical protein